MPTLSSQISALKPSPTVALNSKAKALAAAGEDIINLTVGEPDFATPEPIVSKAIEALRAGRTKYGSPGGGQPLREAIAAKLLRDNDLSFEPAQIVAGIGAKEILFHLALATLNEGDEVIIPAPYWVSYTAHCDAVGAKAVTIPFDPDQIDLLPEVIEKHSSAKTKSIILNSPNNPGGFLYSKSGLQKLADYLAKKDWWVISDEIYEYMVYEGEHCSLLNLNPALKDRYIHVNGLSKGFAMTGWRVGYAASPTPVAKLLKNLQSQSSTSIPGFIEDAATYALNQGRSLMERELGEFAKRRQLVMELADSIEGISYVRPTAAFYLFIDLRQVLPAGMSSMEFCERLLVEEKAAMVPGEAFGVSGFARMSYASSEENLKKGLLRLNQLIGKLKG